MGETNIQNVFFMGTLASFTVFLGQFLGNKKRFGILPVCRPTFGLCSPATDIPIMKEFHI